MTAETSVRIAVPPMRVGKRLDQGGRHQDGHEQPGQHQPAMLRPLRLAAHRRVNQPVGACCQTGKPIMGSGGKLIQRNALAPVPLRGSVFG